MDTTCIMCPMGCPLHIESLDGKVVVTGNTCKRGEIYGTAEFTTPIRMVTSLIHYKSGVTSVKTSQPIDKKLIGAVLDEIAKVNVQTDLQCGDVVIKNVAGSGADLVVTGNI